MVRIWNTKICWELHLKFTMPSYIGIGHCALEIKKKYQFSRLLKKEEKNCSLFFSFLLSLPYLMAFVLSSFVKNRAVWTCTKTTSSLPLRLVRLFSAKDFYSWAFAIEFCTSRILYYYLFNSIISPCVHHLFLKKK